MTARETSVGALVVNSKNEFLLLFSRRSSYWCFPKGHMEGEESDELKTMDREVKEETGINSYELIKGFRELEDYDFDRDDHHTDKEAIFYLIRTDDPVEISIEHKDFKWVDYKTALNMVKHDAQKRMITKAYELLTK